MKELGSNKIILTPEVIVPKTTREKTADQLMFMRDAFSDKIPTKILHSFDKDNKYKVKRGWFSGLNAHLENALISGILTDEVAIEVNKYFEWHDTKFCSKKDKDKITTQEDISKANEIISIVLKDLGFEQKI